MGEHVGIYEFEGRLKKVVLLTYFWLKNPLVLGGFAYKCTMSEVFSRLMYYCPRSF